MSTIVLPQGFSYVVASLLSIVLALCFQFMVVTSLRRASGIKYPQLYAEQAQVDKSKDVLRYNCAQRAHANSLELIPIVLITTIVTGLKYPKFAAIACGLWSVSRVPYTLGYATGDPSKRNSVIGRLAIPICLVLIGTSIWTVAGLVIQAGI